MQDQNPAIDVYYDMDIAQICQHFGKSRNTVDKAVAKLVKNYPDSGWKYKNPETKRITIKAEGVEKLSGYFRKDRQEISTVETELRNEITKLNAIITEKDKAMANMEALYTERLKLEIEKSTQTFLLEQKSKEEKIDEQEGQIEKQAEEIKTLQSENQILKSEAEKTQEENKKQQDELSEYRRKEAEYNSKSFFYRLTHKFNA